MGRKDGEILFERLRAHALDLLQAWQVCLKQSGEVTPPYVMNIPSKKRRDLIPNPQDWEENYAYL
jgi:hypothetical protein